MNLKEDEYWLIQTGLRYGPVTSSDVDMWQNQIQTSGRNKNSLFSEYTLNNLLIPRFLATWTEINSGGHVFSKYVLHNFFVSHWPWCSFIADACPLLQIEILCCKGNQSHCRYHSAWRLFPLYFVKYTSHQKTFQIEVVFFNIIYILYHVPIFYTTSHFLGKLIKFHFCFM